MLRDGHGGANHARRSTTTAGVGTIRRDRKGPDLVCRQLAGGAVAQPDPHRHGRRTAKRWRPQSMAAQSRAQQVTVIARCRSDRLCISPAAGTAAARVVGRHARYPPEFTPGEETPPSWCSRMAPPRCSMPVRCRSVPEWNSVRGVRMTPALRRSGQRAGRVGHGDAGRTGHRRGRRGSLESPRLARHHESRLHAASWNPDPFITSVLDAPRAVSATWPAASGAPRAHRDPRRARRSALLRDHSGRHAESPVVKSVHGPYDAR